MTQTHQILNVVAIAIGLISIPQLANAQIPKTSVRIARVDTALVVVDPQIDFLSPKGMTSKFVGKTVEVSNNLMIGLAGTRAIGICPHQVTL